MAALNPPQTKTPVEKIEQIGNCPEKEICLVARVQNRSAGWTACKSSIDTGNTLRVSCAIDSKFHEKLGVGFKTISRKKCGTAKKGAQLQGRGMSNPVRVKFDGLNTVFILSPRVIEDLHADLNVSNLFLKKVRANMAFSMEKTTLTINDESTELIQQIAPEIVKEEGLRVSRPKDKGRSEQTREKSAGVVHCLTAKTDVTCKPNSLTFIPVNRQRGMIRVQPLDDESTCQPIGALYSNTDKIALLNLGDEPRRIPKRNPICTFQYVTHGKPASRGSREEMVTGIRTETDVAKGSPEEEKKVKELWTQLKLDENVMLRARPDLHEKVYHILKKHWTVFSSEAQVIGQTDLLEFEVELVPGTKPFRGKVRPLNPAMKQSLKEQLAQWEREGVVEECFSPWASPLVPVAKPNGKTRWCVDYRQLNAATVADSYPLPNISENLDRLAGAKVFSTLDASQAYQTIPVAEGSRKALAFVTPFGLYTFARMPMGARNAGATYSRFVQMCLDKLRSPYTMSYLDDIIMFTTDLEQHVEELDKVLDMHGQAGIKLVPGKTHLFQKEVDYLGFRVGNSGIQMREDYVDKIINWPSPRTTKELRSFLGFCGYYRTFIRGYSRLTSAMNSMRCAKKFEWSAEMEKNFKTLKKKFKQMPIRSFPRFDLDSPFQISSDWSKDNVAAVLSQVQDGKERLIAVFGRKTTKGERNYPPWKGELSAMIFGIRKAEHILRFRPFIANTDASALVHLRRLKSLTGILARWMQELQTYDFTVKHKRGVDNGSADGPSRSSHMPEEEPEDWDEGIVADMTDQIDKENLDEDLDRETLIAAQKEDPELMQVRRWLTEGKPSHEDMKGMSENLKAYAQVPVKEEADGMLVRHVTPNKAPDYARNVILVPEKFKDAVFYWSHQHASAGHFSDQPTVMRAKMKWFYPGMTSDLKRKIRSCSSCLAKARVDKKDCVYRPRKSGFPGERLNIDLVGPLPETPTGNRYILTIEDSFTRFCHAVPIRTKESKHVADALIERFICIFGCPLEILSDQGGEFVNRTWKELMKRLEIRKKETPPYNPNSNPVERFHRTLNTIFRTFLDREDPGWERVLPMATLAYNSKCHSSTGQTPFLAWMGREAKLPIDLIVPTPHQQYETVEQHTDDVLRRFQAMFSQMKENNEAIFRRNARLYSGNLHDYKVGDRVFYYTGRKLKNKPTKITFGWLGPYELKRKVSDVIWTLQPCDTEGDQVTVHVTRIRPYYGPRETARAVFPEVKDLEDLGDELAEELTSPVRWTPLTDELYSVPVKWALPEAMIRDLPKKKKTKDATQQSDPIATGTRPKVRTKETGPASKRERSEDSSDSEGPDRHKPRPGQGDKRRANDSSGRDEPARHKHKPAQGDKRGPEPIVGPSHKKFLQRNEKRPPESDADQDTSLKAKVSKLLIPSDDSTLESASAGTSSEDDVLALGAEGGKTDVLISIRSAQKMDIPAYGTARVKLKAAGKIPEERWLMVASRPALADKGILVDKETVRTGPDMAALIRNEGGQEVRLEKGQRVATGVLLPTCADPSTAAGRGGGRRVASALEPG